MCLKAYDESYSKIIRGHKYKDKDNDKDNDKDKDTDKVPENPTYAIFLKSWWLTHSKHDDRYFTLVILFTPVILVTLFRSYNQFYRAEGITVLGFLDGVLIVRNLLDNIQQSRAASPAAALDKFAK